MGGGDVPPEDKKDKETAAAPAEASPPKDPDAMYRKFTNMGRSIRRKIDRAAEHEHKAAVPPTPEPPIGGAHPPKTLRRTGNAPITTDDDERRLYGIERLPTEDPRRRAMAHHFTVWANARASAFNTDSPQAVFDYEIGSNNVIPALIRDRIEGCWSEDTCSAGIWLSKVRDIAYERGISLSFKPRGIDLTFERAHRSPLKQTIRQSDSRGWLYNDRTGRTTLADRMRRRGVELDFKSGDMIQIVVRPIGWVPRGGYGAEHNEVSTFVEFSWYERGVWPQHGTSNVWAVERAGTQNW
jgi:hypothetical protein